jgi:thioredoxin-like negative regulator of GroEL
VSEQKNSAQQQSESKDAAVAESTSTRRSKSVIVLLVVVAFLVLALAKIVTDGGASTGASTAGPSSSGTSITSVRNDAVADYEAALQTGKPVYVMFHSLTCQPCVEISAVADEVMPGYADEVVFVNAITDDDSARELASRFAFQYIPTSFFLAPDGTVVDTHTGTLSEAEMQAFLDRLVTQ